MVLFSGITCLSVETITLKKGQTHIIELPSNPTTGFSWYLKDKLPVKSIVGIQKTGYEPEKTGLVGSGGTQFWNIRARRQGTIHVTFEYKRPWEKGTEPAETKEFVIEIK